jgi:hypothetical protein
MQDEAKEDRLVLANLVEQQQVTTQAVVPF